MKLHELGLPIGKPVTLTIKGQDYKEHTFDAQLIGYEVNHVLLLSVPVKPGQVLLHDGLQVGVEIRLPEGVVNFDSDIGEVSDWGFRFVKLYYPGNVDYQNPRKHIRVPANDPVEIIGHTDLGVDTGTMKGYVLDLSSTGIRVVLEKELTSLVKEVTINMHLQAYDLEQYLSVKAFITNEAPLSEDYPEYGYGYGLSFKALPEASKWFLHAYILEHLLHQKVIIFS